MSDNAERLLQDIGHKFDFITDSFQKQIIFQANVDSTIKDIYKSMKSLSEEIKSLSIQIENSNIPELKTTQRIQERDIIQLKNDNIELKDKIQDMIIDIDRNKIQMKQFDESQKTAKKFNVALLFTTLTVLGTGVFAFVSK